MKASLQQHRDRTQSFNYDARITLFVELKILEGSRCCLLFTQIRYIFIEIKSLGSGTCSWVKFWACEFFCTFVLSRVYLFCYTFWIFIWWIPIYSLRLWVPKILRVVVYWGQWALLESHKTSKCLLFKIVYYLKGVVFDDTSDICSLSCRELLSEHFWSSTVWDRSASKSHILMTLQIYLASRSLMVGKIRRDHFAKSVKMYIQWLV